ncbi:hypothetical protein BH18GEM1_BH18GEM1_04900 [soil metagenome]
MKMHRNMWVLALGVALLPLALARATAESRGVRGEDSMLAAETEAADSTVGGFAAHYGISQSLARTIYDHAIERGVEPALLFGLIAMESSFNPRARGTGGAVGLMQIKPSTARIYDRRVTAEQLMRPEVNVRLGIRHLLREVEYFGNNWTLGLLAYNMGRTALTRALARGHLPRNSYAIRILAHCEGACS